MFRIRGIRAQSPLDPLPVLSQCGPGLGGVEDGQQAGQPRVEEEVQVGVEGRALGLDVVGDVACAPQPPLASGMALQPLQGRTGLSDMGALLDEQRGEGGTLPFERGQHLEVTGTGGTQGGQLVGLLGLQAGELGLVGMKVAEGGAGGLNLLIQSHAPSMRNGCPARQVERVE